MMMTQTIPISQNWTTKPTACATATASDVNLSLARFEVADIDPLLIPFLAAAAAELAMAGGITWRFSVDDAPVALLRLIAKVAIREPQTGGPHTGRLYTQLTQRPPHRSSQPSQ